MTARPGVLPLDGGRITGRIPGLVPVAPDGVLTWAGEPLTTKRTWMSEPKDMLDTSVNGLEDPPVVFDGDAWQQVDWRMHEQRVRRLRRRIFKAVRDGDLAQVRNLQKLTAPRSALSYPRFSREELEGRFLGPMAYLDPKR